MAGSTVVTENFQVGSHCYSSLKGFKFPQTLSAGFLDSYEKLSPSQAGHLRHFHNLAIQLDGEWRHMGTQDPGQEWLDAYRYQLAMMAYAAGLAHYHRLPALRSVFKALLERLIQKMLRREVWGYWYLASQSGKFVDPDIVELRKPWPDPVKRENIMYSGHLLLMVALHAMLFDDDKYDKPAALTFHWNPLLWGMGPETFSYSRTTLQQAILAEMERENWLGACCEPNNVFIVCNQFPIIAMRYTDLRNGTNVVDDVLEKYTTAWRSKNGFTQGGELLVSWYMVNQQTMVSDGSVGVTACASAFMNSWNSDFVHAMYPSQSLGFLSHLPDGRVNLNNPEVAHAIRLLAKEKDMDANALETIQEANRMATRQRDSIPPSPFPPQPDFGSVAQWVSEVGDTLTLQGLLRHADQFLNPTWERGGLFYPRNDEKQDRQGNWTAVDPYTGNAAIGYARLNVRNGQRTMWQRPWSKDHFSDSPFVDGIELSAGVDFLRCSWDDKLGAMVVTCCTWDGAEKRVNFLICNLPTGTYGIYKNGHLADVNVVQCRGDVIDMTLEVGGSVLDIVLLRETPISFVS